MQGEQVFFVVTNYIETPNQRLGFCAEVRIGRTLAFYESRKVIVKKINTFFFNRASNRVPRCQMDDAKLMMTAWRGSL